MKKHTFLRIAFVLLVIVISLVSLAACNVPTKPDGEESTTAGKTEATEDFDFSSADMNDYISLDPAEYASMIVTISDVYEVNDKNVKSYIDGLLKEYPQPLKITDRPVVEGDTVYIYYQGLLNGVAFQGGTYNESSDSEPYALKIGSGKFIDGFEDGLIGVIPSETSKDNPVALNLTFPTNYQNTDLAGKDVVFNVYIKYISNETYVPEYNEDTVVNVLGFKAETDDVIGEFESYIKELLQNEQNDATLAAANNLLFEKATVISYPKQSVDFWYDYYVDQIQQYVDYYAMYGMSVTFEQMAKQMLKLTDGEDWKTVLTEIAESNAKSRMIYYAVAQQSNIIVSDQDYQDMVKYFVDYYKNNGYSYTEQQIIEGIGEDTIRENALFQKVDDFLLARCSVSFTSSSN